MIKVLQLRSTGALLGAENVVLELAAKASEEFGYTSIIGVLHTSTDPYPDLATESEKRGIPFQIFSCKQKTDPRCIKQIRDFCRQNSIDVIHSHGYREDICATLSFSSSKKVATNHLWKKSNRTLRAYAFLDSISMIAFDHIVAVSRPIYEEMKNIPYLNNKKISLISNGIDTKKFTPRSNTALRKELGINDDAVVITSISSLTKEKGHRYLIDAIERLVDSEPNFHCIIVGDGQLRRNIENSIASKKLGNHITLTGRRTDISDIHSSTDIFILPSTKEGMPMALLEAMSSGLPCIATNVGDISQCVRNNETGILIKPKDVTSIYNALIDLIRNPIKRENMGITARDTVVSNYSSRNMISKYADIYKLITGRTL